MLAGSNNKHKAQKCILNHVCVLTHMAILFSHGSSEIRGWTKAGEAPPLPLPAQIGFVI